MENNQCSSLNNQFIWNENFENFEKNEAIKYHECVTTYPFNKYIYDNLLIKILDTAMPKGRLKILDAGGGTGKWSIYFAKMGHEVYLLDISKPMLSVASEVINREKLNNNIKIFHGSIDNLPFEDGYFDVVFSDRNPISHCGKKEVSYKAISEYYRVIKQGGIVIASVLNRMRKVVQMVMELEFDKAYSLFHGEDLRRGKNEYTHFFTSAELIDVLTKTGYRNVHLYPTTTFTEFIPTAWILDEIALKKLFILENDSRCNELLLDYGVRFHFVAEK